MTSVERPGGDECDFDALAALLSSDDEDMQSDVAVVTTQSHAMTNTSAGGATNLDSSDDDDDIDEDELERLVAMTEEDLNPTPTESLTTTVKPCKRNYQQKDVCGKAEDRALSVAPPAPPESRPRTVPSVHLDVESMEEVDVPADPQKELLEMRKRLAVLEAALLKQTAAPSTTTTNESTTKQTVARVSQSTTLKRPSGSRISHCSGSSRKSSNDPPVRPTQKMRVLEEDIFSPPSQGASRKTPPSSGKTSLLPAADDGDGDWEGLDGERTSGLSDAGNNMQVLLDRLSGEKNGGDYVSHSQGSSASTPRSRSWQDRSNSGKSARQQHVGEAGDIAMTEPFSGLRVIKPLVSSSQMKQRVANRKMIRLSKLHTRVNTDDLKGDWVTVGVIINKTEPRMSSKGKQYSTWKISDLDDCTKLVSFYLFGDTHKQHWKLTVGSVIGLLNANIMQNSDSYQSRDSSQVSITVDHAQKLMLIGQSKDFGVCKSKTRAGNSCTNVINRSQGDNCSYHVQAAYKRLSAKRSEIQAGYTGVVPRSFEKRLFGKSGDAVMYQGQTFTTTGHAGSSRKPVTIKHLQQHNTGAKSNSGQVTTLTLHQMQSDGHVTPKSSQASAKVKDDAFLDLLTAPSIGAMNFVKHLMKKEKVDEASKSDKPIESVSATQLLKDHKAEMRRKIQARKQKLANGSPNGDTVPVKAKSPLEVMPQLGRGLTPGTEFDLGAVSVSNRSHTSERHKARVALAKERAISQVKEKGGIKKSDPNAVKKVKTAKVRDHIEKRLNSSEGSPPAETEGRPPRKRSRLLGDIDLNSPEVQKLMKANSSHSGAVNEEAQHRQDQYFDVLEKKEQMEQKMSNIREMKCRVVSCQQCKYTAFTATDICKAAGHEVVSHNATRRFFACKDCKKPTSSFFKYPTIACSKCAGNSFERASMYKEKKGPSTDKEDFEKHLRGDESKFINSMI